MGQSHLAYLLVYLWAFSLPIVFHIPLLALWVSADHAEVCGLFDVFMGDTSSFVLATPVLANTYILIGVGIETYNSFLSNDCGINSTVEARLLSRRIGETTTS